jgi:GNAT superfamily N-acetyltransferase
MIEVRRATPADKQGIFELLPKAYAEKSRYKFPERWEWQFEKNPFRKGNELPVWIAVDENGAVVGQIGTMIEPLKIGTETHRVGWGVDAFLLPECRGRGIGLQLYKAAIDGSDVYVGLRMAETARAIQTTLGAVPVDPVAFFARVDRLDATYTFTALRYRLENKWQGKALLRLLHILGIDRLIAALVNLRVGMRDLGLGRHTRTGMAITRIDRFDRAADRFWDSVAPQFHAVIQRSSEYLNWKYVQQPHMDYESFTASRDGKLCGYIVLRKTRPPESNSGIVADLLVPIEDRETIRSLLAFAVRRFKELKVNHISAASSCTAYQDALRALGFRKTRDCVPLFHSRVMTPAIASALVPGSWFLGRSDSDSDQFPYE